MLDILKPIAEEFESEYRALGTAYTTGEILYDEKAAMMMRENFETVISKGKKYHLPGRQRASCAWRRPDLLNGEPSKALVIGARRRQLTQ